MNMQFDVIKVSPVSADKIDYTTLIFKVTLPQKVDIDNSKDLWVYLKTLASGGAQKMFIDLRQVTYIDSSGIGVLINTAKLLRKQKGDIVMANVSDDIKSIFKVIRLEEFITIFNTEVEAVKSFSYIR
ncbi:MAG TPA: STAS domain-containing protein [Spirochaetota bacterium]|nr:STAS domain-containing protein [Spirochaetota bacterium]HPC40641.1 STAS domain-containing protein [Spirochaetota bacterium]HPL18248.1 STAS domain-containing protein [Spirochaetota bacterium]HQF10248.1 STAS domain-containing protein [Spirochaetota bacterium]HQH99126.1 STAS domain-containing protein [Spirochaetota bacterium]